MKIAIGCDHIVTPIKNEVIKHLKEQGIEIVDCGTYDQTRTHYPIYGAEVGRQVALKKVDLGVVICGTGIGITNGANKVKGVRCALVRDITAAIKAKEDYNANIIGMGGRVSGVGLIEDIVDHFIAAKYKGKNDKIIAKINNLIVNDNYNTNKFDEEITKWERGDYTEGKIQDKIVLPKTY